MKTVWDFVEKYYPNYTSDSSITENEDLQKIVDGEFAEEMFYDRLKEYIAIHTSKHVLEVVRMVEESFQLELHESNALVFKRAIEGFIEGVDNTSDEPKNKFYYLLGSDAVGMYERGVSLEVIKKNELFGVFLYTVGKTKHTELLAQTIGWNDITEINESEYQFLTN